MTDAQFLEWEINQDEIELSVISNTKNEENAQLFTISSEIISLNATLEGKKRTENLLSISVATNEMKIKNKLDAIQMKKRIVKRLNTMSNFQPTKIASCKNNFG